MSFDEVLFNGWVGWDGNGVSSVPAKNVTLIDGSEACLIIDGPGVAIYEGTVEEAYTQDPGDIFIDYGETPDQLVEYISTELIKECEVIIENYRQYQLEL